MIVAGLAANTAAALLQRLQGKPHGGTQDVGSSAVEQFGAKLDALIPGAGAASQAVAALGAGAQDILGKLGIGPDAAGTVVGQPQDAARAYAATSAAH